MRIKFFTFILLLTIFSCQDIFYTEKPKPDRFQKVTITTLDKERELISLLGQIGFSQSNKKSYVNARSSSDGYQIRTDSILKVLQSDSIRYTYTFKIEKETPVSVFENLVLKKVNGGYLGFILRYESANKNFSDMSTFNGTIKRFNLEDSLLSEKKLIDGKLVSDANLNGRTTKDCAEAIRMAYEAYDGTPCENLWDDFDDGCYLVIYIEECDSSGTGGGTGGGGDTGGGDTGGGDTSGGSDSGGGTFIPDPNGGGSGGTGSGDTGGSGDSGSGDGTSGGTGTSDPR